MSAKSKLFAQMKEKKKSVAKDVVNESAVVNEKEDTSIHTSVNTPENKPAPVSGCGDVTGDVDTSALDCVDETACGYVNTSDGVGVSDYVDVSETGNGRDSALTFGEISILANENVNVRDLKSKIKKNKKIKFEESHVKRTLWISKDNSDVLNIWRENGFNITKEVNSALSLWFNLKSKGLEK